MSCPNRRHRPTTGNPLLPIACRCIRDASVTVAMVQVSIPVYRRDSNRQTRSRRQFAAFEVKSNKTTWHVRWTRYGTDSFLDQSAPRRDISLAVRTQNNGHHHNHVMSLHTDTGSFGTTVEYNGVTISTVVDDVMALSFKSS